MLTPVPGLTHLKVLVPPTPLIDVTPPPPRHNTPAVQHRASGLVRIALEVTFGMRPPTQLTRRSFADPVRKHISARLRSGVGAGRGPVRIDTLHLREDGEIFGTAVAAGHAHAFAARLDGQQLASFRVL